MKKGFIMVLFIGLSVSAFSDYYICYGSFRQKENAFAEAAALKTYGIDATVAAFDLSGGRLFRVIHPKGYADRDSAKWKLKYITAGLDREYPTQKSFWVFESSSPAIVETVEAPVAETVEETAVEEPVAEAVEETAVEEPVVEAVEETAVEEPVAEAVEETAVEEPVAEAVEETAVEEPVAEAVEETAVEEPVAEAVEETAVEEPVAEAVEETAVEEPVAEAVEETAVEEPVTETVEETAVEAPVAEAVEETAVEAPVAEAVEETAVEAPVAEAVEETAVEEPVAEAVEETAVEEPVAEAVEETISFSLEKDRNVRKTLFDAPADVYAVIPSSLTAGQETIYFTVNLYRDKQRIASKTGDLISDLNFFSVADEFPEAAMNGFNRTCEYTVELILGGEVLAESSFLYFNG